VQDALPVVLSERASTAGVLGAVAGGVLGSHARKLLQEAGGVRAEPAEDLLAVGEGGCTNSAGDNATTNSQLPSHHVPPGLVAMTTTRAHSAFMS